MNLEPPKTNILYLNIEQKLLKNQFKMPLRNHLPGDWIYSKILVITKNGGGGRERKCIKKKNTFTIKGKGDLNLFKIINGPGPLARRLPPTCTWTVHSPVSMVPHSLWASARSVTSHTLRWGTTTKWIWVRRCYWGGLECPDRWQGARLVRTESEIWGPWHLQHLGVSHSRILLQLVKLLRGNKDEWQNI